MNPNVVRKVIETVANSLPGAKERAAQKASAEADAAQAAAAARMKRIADSNASYAERVRAAALNPRDMKKGGPVKKKVATKAKARKK